MLTIFRRSVPCSRRLSWLTNGTVLSTRMPLKPRVRILEAANQVLSLENWGHRRLLFPEGSIPAATDLSCSKDLAFRPSFLTFGPGNWCRFSNCQGHVHLESLPETMFADTKDCSSFSPVQVWTKKPAAHWLPVPWCTVPRALCLGLGSFVESTLFFYSLDLKVLAKSQTKSFYQISS